MKNWLRFSVATAASMLLIAVGVVVSYIGCDGGAGIQAPTRASAGNPLEADAVYEPAGSAEAAESSTVYFTADISPAGLLKAYDALNLPPPAGAKVAVKLSTGEPPNSNYLRAGLIKDFIQSLSGANIVECNTVYPGTKRGTTREHRQVAIEHGFAAIAPVVIMDSAGSLSIPVARVSGVTRHLDSNYVGKAFADYDYYVILSHFKGHAMAGLGGAIKNISIGIGSAEGKCWIHTAGKSKTSFSGGVQNDFQESMAEAGKAVVDHLKNRNGKILYINVMNKLSVDCDCFGNPSAVEMADIGILSSLDPVALDQACVDLVKKATDGTKLVNRMTEKNGYLMVSHGAKIGLGSQTYKVLNLDDNTTSVKIPERRQAPSTAAMCELVKSK
jgi:uncharacterized Fe-S center protein